MTADGLDAAPQRPRGAVLCVLIAVTAAAWIYLLLGAGIGMEEMDMGGGSVMMMMPAWTPRYAALVLLMWSVMMAAMMLPSAAPAIFEAAGLAQPRADEGITGIRAALLFITGYLTVWTGFSIAATFLQWALDAAHLLSETMAIGSTRIALLLMIAVGVYQTSPLKQRFLRRCRTSDGCVAADQRRTAPAALRQGMRYGVSCVGCCAALMCLPFAGGVMNALWLAAISLWVLAEKTLPWGSGIARLGGAGLVVWGTVSLAL